MTIFRSLTLPRLIVLLSAILAAFASPGVSKAQIATTTTLTASSCSTAGCVTTLTATVTAGTVAVHPGLVLFCKSNVLDCRDSVPLGQAQLLANGTATVKLVLPSGSNSINAVFQGTKTYSKSQSAAQSVSGVAIKTTATTVSGVGAQAGSPNTPPYKLSSTVFGFSKASPTGTVSFLDASNNNSLITSATLSAGTPNYVPGLNLAAIPTSILSNVQAAAVGDFNNDGFLDVVVITRFNSATITPAVLQVLLGDGKGNFTLAPADQTSIPLAALEQIVVADFNGDGKLDIAMPGGNADHNVYVALGNGDGTFTDATPTSQPNYPNALYVGDFNNDGIPDLAASGTVIQPMLGKGDGTFTVTPQIYSSDGTLVIADFGGSGNLDVAAAGGQILEGAGDGTFSVGPSLPTIVGEGVQGIAVGDFNNDGKPDIVEAGFQSLTYMQGDGNWTFKEFPQQTWSSWPEAQITSLFPVEDFNGDGFLDVAAETDSSVFINQDYALQIFPGSLNSTYGVAFSLGLNPSFPGLGNDSVYSLPLLADFNSDGIPDLLSFNFDGTEPDYIPPTADVYGNMATAATTSAFYIPGNGYQNVVASYSGDTAHTASVSSPVSVLGTSANFPNGFGGASGTAGLSLNGNPVIQGSTIELTNGGNFQASGFFTKSRVPVDGFTTQFNFQITNAESDGLAFVVQSNGPNAMGSAGGGIGYGLMPGHTTGANIPNSFAVLFDLHNNQGEGDNSVRIALNGNVTPGNASIGGETAPFDLTPSGIDLHSGHHFHAEIDYGPVDSEGNFVMVTLTDLDTTKSVTTYFGDPGLSTTVGDSVGYVGFTAATGTETANIMIQNWIFSGVPSCSGTTLCGPIPQVSLGNGFSGSASLLQLNGGSEVSGSALQLTHDTPLEATSSYYTQQVTLSGSGHFNTDFDFTLGNGNGDGFTFVLQDQGPTAVGGLGGGLGYGPDQPNGSGNKIAQSVAVKFDLHNNAGEGINSTGIYTDGASPTVPAIDLTSSGINLHSGHTFHARLCYCNGTDLSLSITDLTDFAVFNTSFPINLVNTIGASTAYAGFTAGTGTSTDTTNILDWTWNNF